MMKLKNLTISQAAELLKKGELTSVSLCEQYLSRISEIDSKIRAFVNIGPDDIMKQAEESDVRRKNWQALSDYDGIPVSMKDLISVKGQKCTCGSKILSGYVAPYDATAVSRLRKAGFVIFGRNNMDEFAMGSTCESSSYFPTSNPWDLARVPGGSSGGSAAAVSAGEVTASLGSDTGGSVRQPAAFCGVVGLKPSYGRVSRYGLVAYASSLDQIGPITRDVTDAAILTDLIAGQDPLDNTTLHGTAGCHDAVKNAPKDFSGVRIGLPREYFEVEGLDSAVRKNMDNVVALLRELGAEIVNVSLPHSKYAIASYYIIATAEASANLARFDGIRYGKRTDDFSNLNELYLNSRGQGFGDEVKRRILLGTFVLSSGYYDAYYLKAQKVRTLIRQDFVNAFKSCDVIISPTSPCLPFRIGELTDPVQMYLADIYTISLNLAGICGVSVPSDIVRPQNLPVDVQFIGPSMCESRILSAARVFEENRQIKDFIPDIP